jgi:tetraacyldisaccharide 4'-kinase
MIILRLLLLPISILYGLILQVRNLFYDWDIFKVTHFNKPIISIGNITAGGTGKTPFTIYLAGKLIERGKKVAIISRGYGRKSKGFHLYRNDCLLCAGTDVLGDEPVLMARRLSGAIIAVSEKRSVAINYILKNFDVDVVLLDDGFQHRAVGRELDIVLLKDVQKLKNKFVLPSGLLREFKFNLKRARIIICDSRPTKRNTNNNFFSNSELDGFYDLYFKKVASTEDMRGQKCIAFAGIAHPQKFKESLESTQIVVLEFIPFKDHYNFQKEDLDYLIELCRQKESYFIVCTEKDLVKIGEISQAEKLLEENKIKLLSPRLKVSLHDEQSFLKNIEYLS